METSITFYRGIDTIGGIIFEVSYGKESFICDYGKPMNHPLFSKDIHLSRADLKDIGYIPDIKRMHDKDAIVAVGVSHLHIDHTGMLDYLPNDVAIYMSEPSKKLYEQLIYINEETGSHIKNTCGITYNTKVKVTPNISVTFIPVNHDVPGASSMMIETPDCTVVFSGDVRLHKHDKETREWMRRVKHTDYLIIESTGFFEDKDYVETEELTENIDSSELLEGMATLNYDLFIFKAYHRDINRLKYLVRYAKEHGQPIVFEKKTARLLENYLNNGEKSNVYYYDTPSENTPRTIQKADIEVITRGFVQNSFENIAALKRFNLERACYLHLNGTPLGPYDSNYNVLLDWLRYYNLEIVNHGTSGHAEAGQIKHMITEINPKAYTAVHGLNPHRLKGANHFPAKHGETYILEDILRHTIKASDRS